MTALICLELSTIDERKKNALHPPTANRLLCELPEEVKQRIFPHLELIELKAWTDH